jgi:hypothetical protein
MDPSTKGASTRRITAGALLAVALLVAGCSADARGSESPSPSAFADAAAESPAAAASICQDGTLSVERGPYTIAGWLVPGMFPGMGLPGWERDDVALRSIVVAAEVVSKKPGFFADASPGVYPDDVAFTPFVVRVFRAIHGDASIGEMPVAVEGGTVGCYRITVDVAPRLEVGARYVFFLRTVVTAGPLMRDVWEAWPIDSADMVSTPGGAMPLTDLATRIDRLAATRSPTPAAASSARP